MKKNKTIAYMMAAMLLVGGTFLGTKALFTDQLDTVGELAISTGDVDIEVIEDKGWVLDRNGAELKDGTTVTVEKYDSISGDVPAESGGQDTWENITSDPKANNLKPGDVLTKTVIVQNQGTLVGKLGLTADKEIQEKLGVLSELITATGSVDKPFIKPGETATLTLKLEVENKGGKHNEEGYNTDDIENHKVDLKNAWVLTATQQD